VASQEVNSCKGWKQLFYEDVMRNKKEADLPIVAKDIMRGMRAGWRSIESYMQFL